MDRKLRFFFTLKREYTVVNACIVHHKSLCLFPYDT